jgi:hypothetical protein
MNKIDNKDHFFKGLADKLELNQANLDSKHGGEACDYHYEQINDFYGNSLITENFKKNFQKNMTVRISRNILRMFKNTWTTLQIIMAARLISVA